MFPSFFDMCKDSCEATRQTNGFHRLYYKRRQLFTWKNCDMKVWFANTDLKVIPFKKE